MPAPYLEALRRGLAERGWAEGRLRIESRSAEGDLERLPGLAAELVGLEVSIIVTGLGTPAALAAKGATARLPIVFVTGGDPVDFGIVSSRAKPGGNVTGLGGGPGVIQKRLELLREVSPRAKRFGFLRNLANPIHPKIFSATQQAAGRMGLTLEELGLFEAPELDGIFKTIAAKRIDALVVPGDAMFSKQRALLIGLAAKGKVAAICGDRLFPEAGGLMSFSVDLLELCRRAADPIDKVLRGARAGDLPVGEAAKFAIVMSAGAAQDLGLTIPPALRKQAVILK
jgi:putative ABC transport system substrate-binding protein